MTHFLYEAAAFWVSITAGHCLAQLTSDLSDGCTTLSGLKTDGGFRMAFSFSLTGATICSSHWQRIRLWGRAEITLWVGMGSRLHGKWG